MRCSEARLNGQAEAFRAFFVLEGRLMSVHRRFHLDFAGLWHLPERYYSAVILTTYAVTTDTICPVGETVLCSGEDPRVVSDGSRAFVLSRSYRAGGGPLAGYKLITLPEAREQEVVVPADFAVGKNWQPFVKEGRLFAVHSFSPLTIVEIGEDAHLQVVHEGATEYWLPAAHDGYTMVRGGSNAVVSADSVVGFGHLSLTRDDHRPFVWELGPSRQMRLSLPAGFFGLRARGFNIIDPTSLFVLGERLHLGLCASEREWFFGQRFLDLLIELSCDDPRELQEAMAEDAFPDLGAEIDHLPPSRTFMPKNMPHQVPNSVVHRGVESQGQGGCLVHGPYEPIGEEESYVADLTYLTVEDGSRQVAGRFEVACFKDGEIAVLSTIKLVPTSGSVGVATVRFSTRGRLGWLLETRVLVEDGVRLNALSIRVMKASVSAPAITDAPEAR